MSRLPIAPFPPATFREDIQLDEWESCLDAWIILSKTYLSQTDDEFFDSSVDGSPLTTFLTTYYRAAGHPEKDELHLDWTKSRELRRLSFLLVHRLFSGLVIPASFLEWPFLTDISRTFLRSRQLAELLQSVWRRKAADIEHTLETIKKLLIKLLESHDFTLAQENLKQLAPLLRVLPETGHYFMTGSDFLDALSSAYLLSSSAIQETLVAVAYLALLSLGSSEKLNYSLLSDHIYGLRSSAESTQRDNPDTPSLLSDLVTNTPFLRSLENNARGPGTSRIKNLIDPLKQLKRPDVARNRQLRHVRADKGKQRATDSYNQVLNEGSIQVHRMSLISQIQDLFPELGSAYVVKLLNEYDDNVEEVTAHYLDSSLPDHLVAADHSEVLSTGPTNDVNDVVTNLEPRSTPLPQRHNIFDDDEFDRLEVDPSRMRVGRKNSQITADKILSDRSDAPNKAAILSALAAFDSDDDERDDTYDAEDVGGTVDAGAVGNDEASLNKNEEALFSHLTTDPEAFGRDAATRRGKARAALKNETGMTDEAIEGWAVMVRRDPQRLRRLEARFSGFSGQQRYVPSTAYRATLTNSGAEESDGNADFIGRGGQPRGRGRGRGLAGRGRGDRGNVAGSSDDRGTQVSRQRKEANKGSRANHNRRDQRAKKMGRGGFA